MRTWTRSSTDQLCGRCGGAIHQGDPVLVLELTRRGNVLGRPLVKVRCAQFDCAGEAVPTDLPPFVSAQTPIVPIVKLPTGIGTLAFDWKHTAAGGGEREP